MNLKKVGILGGTFDPIHLGHIGLAKAALAEMALDEIIFIPSAIPPHKNRKISPFDHRVKMLKIACRGYEKFNVCTIEGDLPKPSFTLDTMVALTEHFGGNQQFYFIIGSDAFLEFTTWKGYEKVLAIVHFTIAIRNKSDRAVLPQFIRDLGYEAFDGCWNGGHYQKSIHVLKSVPPEVSSTDIRSFFLTGLSNSRIDSLLDPQVEEYIVEMGLYSNS